MTRRLWAVFPAAGSGHRFGGERPKQYQLLAGRQMIEWALSPFLDRRDIAKCVVVRSAEDAWWRNTSLSADERIVTATGGVTRQLSVFAGLQALKAQAGDDDWVLVHDVARPCLSRELLQSLIDSLADESVGGLLAVPVTDTLKYSIDGRLVDRTVERKLHWRAQTPQMFRFGLLWRALEQASATESEATDEAQAVEALGYRPVLVHGAEVNLKVTERSDLAMAEKYLLGEWK